MHGERVFEMIGGYGRELMSVVVDCRVEQVVLDYGNLFDLPPPSHHSSAALFQPVFPILRRDLILSVKRTPLERKLL